MKWTDSDLKKLETMYSERVGVKEIAESLCRTEKAIKNKAHVLGITRNRNFSEEEIKYIVDNYGKINLREIAENIGRAGSYTNVCRKARELGITDKNRKKVRHKNTPEPKTKWRFVDGVRTRRKYDSEADRRAAASDFMTEWHRRNEHPRGMKGKTHSAEYKNRRSELTKAMWNDKNSIFNSEEHREELSKRMSKMMVENMKKKSSIYSNAKGGRREDLGFYVRSRWEANVARYLKFLRENSFIFHWEYESETFFFENTKGGIRSYTPDFKVWVNEGEEPCFWEVKGFMDKKSIAKLERMKKEYPDTKIKVIQAKEYKEIGVHSGFIKHWEPDRYSNIPYLKVEYLR